MGMQLDLRLRRYTSIWLVALIGLPVQLMAQDSAESQIANRGDSKPVVAYSLIEGGLSSGAVDGGSNLIGNPLFVHAMGADGRYGTLDDDFRLQTGSLAIDTGDNASLPADMVDFDGNGDRTAPLPVDLGGNRRVFDGGSGTAVVDRGAYEYGAPAVRVGVEQVLPETGPAFALHAAYPNPFTRQSALQFVLRRPTPVQITLYDMLGRSVQTLYQGTPLPDRLHTLLIDGSSLPSGLYVVQLTGDGVVASQKVVVTR